MTNIFRFVSTVAIALCLSFVGFNADAQGNPAIQELRISVQDLDSKADLGFVNPGEVLEMHVGERVRLRMVAVPNGRGRSPLYPSTGFSELAGSGRVNLSQINARQGSAVLEAVNTQHRSNNSATTLIEYQILDNINIRGGLMKGTITIEVLPARAGATGGRAVGLEDQPDLRGQADRRGAILYQYAGYGGRSENFFADDPRLNDNHIREDAVSSVRVDRGCTVTLFRNPGYDGKQTVLTEDAPNLKGSRVGDDEASSLKVRCDEGSRGGRYDDRRDDRYDARDDRYGQRTDGVTLYEHQGYRGRSETFFADDRSLNDNPIQHDAASSIRVSPGCRAVLYEHGDYRGSSTVLEDDLTDLSGTSVGNDSVSSLRVDCPGASSGGSGAVGSGRRAGITLYEHQDFRGRSETFYDSDRGLGDNPIRSDAASSVKVDPGCEVILYEHDAFEGRASVFVSSIADLNGTRVGNDSASSLEVRCR